MTKLRYIVTALLATSPAGFSTAETAAVIAGSSILSATATPQIQEYLESARSVKASGDVRVIAISIVRLTSHVRRIRLNQKVPATVLVGDGEIPEVAGAAARPWALPENGRESQSLSGHLVENSVGYATESSNPLRWRGPYMDGLSADPWGSRYAVNVGLFESTGGHAVLVVSPGPNRSIETPFEAVGLKPGGDDVISVIGSGR